MSQLGREWAAAPYPRNEIPFSFGSEHLLTDSGVFVRSRAELFIANFLYAHGIPFRYECEYVLPSGKKVYPDFTIMHPATGELYYLEYFGMMHEQEYAEAAFDKIREYYRSEDAERFLFLFESAATRLDTESIRNLLTRTFLRQ